MRAAHVSAESAPLFPSNSRWDNGGFWIAPPVRIRLELGGSGFGCQNGLWGRGSDHEFWVRVWVRDLVWEAV